MQYDNLFDDSIMNNDLEKYIEKRILSDPEFANGYDDGYDNFKIGFTLRNLRVSSGMTQEEIAARLNTKKSAISRIENHPEDIRYSTLKSYAEALNKKLKIMIE